MPKTEVLYPFGQKKLLYSLLQRSEIWDPIAMGTCQAFRWRELFYFWSPHMSSFWKLPLMRFWSACQSRGPSFPTRGSWPIPLELMTEPVEALWPMQGPSGEEEQCSLHWDPDLQKECSWSSAGHVCHLWRKPTWARCQPRKKAQGKLRGQKLHNCSGSRSTGSLHHPFELPSYINQCIPCFSVFLFYIN